MNNFYLVNTFVKSTSDILAHQESLSAELVTREFVY